MTVGSKHGNQCYTRDHEAAPAIRPADSACTCMPNNPNRSMTSDIKILAVMVKPA